MGCEHEEQKMSRGVGHTVESVNDHSVDECKNMMSDEMQSELYESNAVEWEHDESIWTEYGEHTVDYKNENEEQDLSGRNDHTVDVERKVILDELCVTRNDHTVDKGNKSMTDEEHCGMCTR